MRDDYFFSISAPGEEEKNNVRVVVVVAVWYSYTPFHRLVMVPYIAEWLPVCNQHTYSRIFIKGGGGERRGRRWTREIYVWTRSKGLPNIIWLALVYKERP